MKDFEADYFSNVCSAPSELVEVRDLSVQTHIKNFYPSLGKVQGVYSYGSLDINSRNVKVVTEEGSFTLKFWENASLNRLNEIIEILLFLGNQTIRTPSPIKNCNQEYVSRTQKQITTLFTYLDGELFGPTPDNLADFFEATGQLFSLLAEIPTTNQSTSYMAAPHQTQKSIKHSLKDSGLWVELDMVEFHENLISMWPSINKDLDLFTRLNHPSKLQYSHYDLHPRNVLFDRNHGFGFLDFDACAVSNPNVAWGFLLIKNLRQACVNKNKKESAKVLSLSALSDLQKISYAQDLDILNLPIYGRYEIAKRLASILDEYTSHGTKIWISMLPVQIQLLRESYLMFGNG